MPESDNKPVEASATAVAEEVKSVPATQNTGTQVSTNVVNFEEDAGAGSESITSKDKVIPFVNILQTLSPQLNKKKEGVYVEGAEEGDFFNTATRKFLKEMIVIPVVFMRRFTEWVPRDKGGGLVADYGSDETCLVKRKTQKNEKGKDFTPEGNEIVQSLTYYSLLYDPENGSVEPIVLSMSSTQIKKARQWNGIITNLKIPRSNGQGTFNPAMFYHSYKLTTVPESKDNNQWMGFKIDSYMPTVKLKNGEEIYQAARDFRQSVLDGTVKADAAGEALHSDDAGESSTGKSSGEDIPF
jgi:hypothetical protein